MKKGFTMVEIMIVTAIIVILAGIAIPSLLRSRITANEQHAVSNIEMISVAAQTYWSVNNALPTTLNILNTNSYLDATLGCASPPCTKSGYRYYMGGTGATTDFFVYTTPQSPNITGVRSFCAGSDGVARANAAGTAPVSQAACNAWTAL